LSLNPLPLLPRKQSPGCACFCLCGHRKIGPKFHDRQASQPTGCPGMSLRNVLYALNSQSYLCLQAMQLSMKSPKWIVLMIRVVDQGRTHKRAAGEINPRADYSNPLPLRTIVSKPRRASGEETEERRASSSLPLLKEAFP